MKSVRVMLETRSDGGGETLDGKGGYEYRKSGSRLHFTAEGASFELLTGNILIIVRKGEVSYELRFCVGEPTECFIETPYGNIHATVRTDCMQMNCSPAHAEIYVEYTLGIGGESSAHSMRFEVLPYFNNNHREKEV